MYTLDHTFGYNSKKFIRACEKSSAHARSTTIRGENFRRTRKIMDGSLLTVQGHVQTSGSDVRTGTSHHSQVTAGDRSTTCSVKGVFDLCEGDGCYGLITQDLDFALCILSI